MSGAPLGKGVTTLRPDRRHLTEQAAPDKLVQAQWARSSRWERRRSLRRFTGLKRIRTCGLSTTSESGATLGVIAGSGGRRSAAYGGLTTCGSMCVCPVCAVKIATRRADDLATVMRTGETWTWIVAQRQETGLLAAAEHGGLDAARA